MKKMTENDWFIRTRNVGNLVEEYFFSRVKEIVEERLKDVKEEVSSEIELPDGRSAKILKDKELPEEEMRNVEDEVFNNEIAKHIVKIRVKRDRFLKARQLASLIKSVTEIKNSDFVVDCDFKKINKPADFILPSEDKWITFKQYRKKHKFPYIYAIPQKKQPDDKGVYHLMRQELEKRRLKYPINKKYLKRLVLLSDEKITKDIDYNAKDLKTLENYIKNKNSLFSSKLCVIPDDLPNAGKYGFVFVTDSELSKIKELKINNFDRQGGYFRSGNLFIYNEKVQYKKFSSFSPEEQTNLISLYESGQLI